MHSRHSLVRFRTVRLWLAAGLALLAAPWLPLATAETRLPESIRQDQVWEEEKSPYRLTGNVTIGKEATVTLLPNVVVRFDKGSRLEVKGTFNADEVFFDGMEDMHNRETLVFYPASRGRLTSCVIQNLELQIRTDQAVITRNAISNMNGSGITVGKACRPTITGNDFHANSYYAVYREGKEVLRTPNNYWGAADGPSGAGPGNGDAVNSPIEFRPFQKADIGEHLVLADRLLDRTTLAPGSRFSMTYIIDNLNSYDHAVILGASIFSDPDHHIHSSPDDLEIIVKPGRHRFTRGFAIPAEASEGRYDVLWGIMKTNLTAYHVLKKDPGIMHIRQEPAVLPAPAGVPGWVPLKASPY